MDVPYQPHAPPISLRPRISLRPSVVPEYLPVPHRLRFKPRLRPRLTLGGLPFPRKPQASGGKVSHLTLVTHAGILSTVQSSLAYALPSTRTVRSPTPNRSQMSEVRCRILSTSLSSCIFASLKLCILLLVRYAMSYLYILSHNLSLVILLFHCLIQALSLNTS